MGTVQNIAIAVLLISFLTFVAFFGRLPALRNTPIGALHRILWIHIPQALRTVDKLLTKGRLSTFISTVAHTLWHDKHPVVVVREFLFSLDSFTWLESSGLNHPIISIQDLTLCTSSDVSLTLIDLFHSPSFHLRVSVPPFCMAFAQHITQDHSCHPCSSTLSVPLRCNLHRSWYYHAHESRLSYDPLPIRFYNLPSGPCMPHMPTA